MVVRMLLRVRMLVWVWVLLQLGGVLDLMRVLVTYELVGRGKRKARL